MPENYKYTQEIKHRLKLVGWKRMLANPNFFWYTVGIPFILLLVMVMTYEIELFVISGKRPLHIADISFDFFERGCEIYLYLVNIFFILRLWIFYNCNKNVRIFFYNHFMGFLWCLNLTQNNILDILCVDYSCFTGILLRTAYFLFRVGGYTAVIIIFIHKMKFSKREKGIYTTLVRLKKRTIEEKYLDMIGICSLCGILCVIVFAIVLGIAYIYLKVLLYTIAELKWKCLLPILFNVLIIGYYLRKS